MPNYKCRTDVVWSPSKLSDKNDAITKITTEMPQYVSDGIADLVVTGVGDENAVMAAVVGTLNTLRGGTLYYKPNDEWNYGSGGLHEDDRALYTDAGTMNQWEVVVKKKDDPMSTVKLKARIRVVSRELK